MLNVGDDRKVADDENAEAGKDDNDDDDVEGERAACSKNGGIFEK